jgi:hypothetical protein
VEPQTKSSISHSPPDLARYSTLSRYTDPKDLCRMKEELPREVEGICAVAKDQTIHHNLLCYNHLSPGERRALVRVRPPRLADVLRALNETESRRLVVGRRPNQRVLGACILESHVLAGMLRHRGIPARVRAAYFRNIMAHPDITLQFWRDALRARDQPGDLVGDGLRRWEGEVDELTRRQIANDHHIEHWVCEYWDSALEHWRLLDANNAFLRTHSGIEVPFELPRKYFEYACEGWKKTRTDRQFDSDQYSEEPQDGRSHLRSQ